MYIFCVSFDFFGTLTQSHVCVLFEKLYSSYSQIDYKIVRFEYSIFYYASPLQNYFQISDLLTVIILNIFHLI